MSFMRYFAHDYWQTSQIDRLDAKVRQIRLHESASRGRDMDRFEILEDDLARMALLVHALSEACVRKGVLTREEITAMIEEVDLADGQADGKLDPAVMRPEDQQRPRHPPTPREHLRELERRDDLGPSEFLAGLEGEAEDA